jgi:anti-sigma regulatory factor (Ser/Thr protein kinase)
LESKESLQGNNGIPRHLRRGRSPQEYIEELEKAIEEDLQNLGKNSLKAREEVTETKEINVSTTDPESGYMVRAVDSGSPHICKELQLMKVFAVIGGRSFTPVKGLMKKWQFKYNTEKNVYVCPTKQRTAKAIGNTNQTQSSARPVRCWQRVHEQRTNKKSLPSMCGKTVRNGFD